jgi:serine/threonine-protein kinase
MDIVHFPGVDVPPGLCQNSSRTRGWTDHPSIANVLKFEWLQDGSYSQVIDLDPGAFSFSTLRASERWSGKQLWQVASMLVSALEHMHRAELVHSALAPETVYQESDNVRIGEFWWAHNADGEPAFERWTNHLDPAVWPSFLLPYMAPEMLRGAPPSRKSDVYSLGAVVYFVLTGRSPRPIPDDSNLDARSVLSKTKVTPILELRPDVGKKAANFLDMQLADDPHERPHIHIIEAMYQYLAEHSPS